MRTNDIKALHGKSIAELLKQQTELEMDLAKNRFQKQAGKLKNTSLPREIADDLARVKTILTEKRLIEKVTVKAETTKVIKKEVKKTVEEK